MEFDSGGNSYILCIGPGNNAELIRSAFERVTLPSQYVGGFGIADAQNGEIVVVRAKEVVFAVDLASMSVIKQVPLSSLSSTGDCYTSFCACGENGQNFSEVGSVSFEDHAEDVEFMGP